MKEERADRDRLNEHMDKHFENVRREMPSRVKLSQNGRVGYADDFWNLDPYHPVLDDPLWPGHVLELKAVAGPSVTD